jgi:hypothetical protein
VKTLYVDIETEPVSHEEELPPFVVGGFACDDGPVQFTRDWSHLRYLMMEAPQLVCHKGAFEAAVMNIPKDKPFTDTSIRATILGAAAGDPDAAGHSLETLAVQRGMPKWKGGKETTLSFRRGVPLTEQQFHYLRKDVEATRFVFKSQGGNIVDIPDEERQTRWSRDVFEVGRAGLHIDLPRLHTLMHPAADKLAELRVQLRTLGIIQPRGPKRRCGCGECDGGPHIWRDEAVGEKHILELLAATGATRRANKGKGVQLAMDAEAFRDSGLPELAVLADYEDEGKWMSLLEGYNQPGGVVRTKYNSLVTTGRMSSSAPNVQQVKKEGGLRECWVPSPGCAFVEADYPGLELYTFADTCRRWGITTQMGDWLDAGVSVHTMIAERANMSRDMAKVLNFGGLGGMGPSTMCANLKKQKGIIVPVMEMEETMKRWKRALPEIWQYREHCERIVFGDRYLVTSPQSGRSRLAFWCASLNFPFQSAGSDVTKRAVELCLAAGINVVAIIHDQLLADVPRRAARDAGVEMARLMAIAHQQICSTVVAPVVEWHMFLDRWVSKG